MVNISEYDIMETNIRLCWMPYGLVPIEILYQCPCVSILNPRRLYKVQLIKWYVMCFDVPVNIFL